MSWDQGPGLRCPGLDVEIVEVGEGGEEAGEGLVEGGDWVVGSRRGATGTRAVPSSLKLSFNDSRNIFIDLNIPKGSKGNLRRGGVIYEAP